MSLKEGLHEGYQGIFAILFTWTTWRDEFSRTNSGLIPLPFLEEELYNEAIAPRGDIVNIVHAGRRISKNQQRLNSSSFTWRRDL